MPYRGAKRRPVRMSPVRGPLTHAANSPNPYTTCQHDSNHITPHSHYRSLWEFCRLTGQHRLPLAVWQKKRGKKARKEKKNIVVRRAMAAIQDLRSMRTIIPIFQPPPLPPPPLPSYVSSSWNEHKVPERSAWHLHLLPHCSSAQWDD